MELVCAVLCLGVYFFLGFKTESFLLIAAIPFLLALVAADLEFMILPNQLVFSLLVIGVIRLGYFIYVGNFPFIEDVLFIYVLGSVLFAIIPLLMGIIMTKITKKESLGLGDVKFFFTAGIWLGLSHLHYFLILSGVLGVLLSFFWQFIFKKSVFPFGPALVASFYILMLFEGSISL